MQILEGQTKRFMIYYYDIFESGLHSNVDYPDSLGSHEIARIIENMNINDEQN